MKDDKTVFGFWIFLMSDAIIFGALFATYAILHGNTFGGPGGKVLFDMPFAFAETIILLASTFTVGLAVMAVNSVKVKKALAWFAVTFVLGATFVTLEIGEFSRFIASGNGPQRSGFLSSYFALVGMHGLHVTLGLLWMVFIMIQISRRGINKFNLSNLNSLGLFWHFLDIIWIFIFTIVYLMGAIGI